MATSKARYLYWDSCVFLAYLNEEPGRVRAIEDLWEEIANEEKSRIVTASISIVEVVVAAHEKNQSQLSKEVEKKLDAMWDDPSVLTVDVPEIVMREARVLIRNSIPQGWRLKCNDAIHLATAMWVHKNINALDEFNTYDGHLKKYEAMTGLQIREPSILQPKLF